MLQRICYFLTFSFLILCGVPVFSQGGLNYRDSLLHRLDSARSNTDKVHLLLELARITMDRAKGGAFADQAIEQAQLSRDQRLIADAYLANGDRYMSNSALADNLTQAMANFQQAEQLARENGMEDRLVLAYCGMSRAWHDRGNDLKALTYSSQALAVAGGVENDTARVMAYLATGRVYMSMNEMLLSLRNFLTAREVAETSGDEGLQRDAYGFLQYFYENIGEYDKAIDYRMKAYALDRKMWDNNMSYDLVQLGDLFLKKNQVDLALKMYEHSIHIADTFNFELLKVNGYHRTFLLYYKTREYKKGLEYFYSHEDMLDILREAGFDYYIGQMLAATYSAQGRYDSALYYFRTSEPKAAREGVPENQFDFYMDYSFYFRKTGDLGKAIVYGNKAYAIAAASGQLGMEEKSTDSLEGLYEAAGKFPAALACERREAVERDSLQTQAQATDLLKLEVENDGRRQERLAREERERTERRHNVQYLGFTIGLVGLFIGLVMLGRLSVSLSLIRALGFLSFIFLFEFIILLADKPIQAWTQEEPWKVLLIKIALGAGLVPLHHWLEHSVVRYLSSRRGRGGNKGAGHLAAAGHGAAADHGTAASPATE